MIDGLIRWSLAHRTDRRRAGGRVPGLGRLDRVAHPARRAARSHGADGHDPDRSAGHGPARDRIARHVPDRVGAEWRGRRAARALGDRGRRRRRVGRVRLGTGHPARAADRHRETDARVRHRCRRTSSRRSSRRCPRSWARSCSSTSNPIGIRRWSSAPSPKRWSGGGCSRCPACRR